MSVITEEKENNKVLLSAEELEYKIEIATQTLDRNVGFVTNCDNKTSIVLAAFGVLLAIILTNEGLNDMDRCVFPRAVIIVRHLPVFQTGFQTGIIIVMLLGNSCGGTFSQ